MGGERMKRVCLTVLCILLVGCGNAETAETENETETAAESEPNTEDAAEENVLEEAAEL